MDYSRVNVEVIEGTGPGGAYRIDGDEIPVRVGSFLRFEPATRRQPIAAPEGRTMIGAGARRGSYEPRGPF